MGCYWRNVSKSWRWSNVEQRNSRPRKGPNRMESGHFVITWHKLPFQGCWVPGEVFFFSQPSSKTESQTATSRYLPVSLVKWLTLFGCLATSKAFRLLWSHIAATAARSGWQPGLSCPFFCHQKMRLLTLHQLGNYRSVASAPFLGRRSLRSWCRLAGEVGGGLHCYRLSWTLRGP